MKRRNLLTLICLLAMVMMVWGADASQPAPPGSITILLLGMDRTEEEERAAAIVLASLNADTGAVKLASIRRDIVLDEEGRGGKKLGMTRAIGGPQATLEEINQLFQLNVKYYVSVDMAGMEKIIDALGGIDVNISEIELAVMLPDGKTKAFQSAGQQTLSGAQALAYMMSRSGEGSGGTHISKALAACMQKGVRMGFDPLIEMVSDLMPYVETNMTLMDMMDTALCAVSATVTGMESRQFPAHGQEEVNEKETTVRLVDSAAEAEAIYAFLYTAPEKE